MCTASWFFEGEGYELFFNRDELRTRLPAEPPRAYRLEGAGTDGVSAILPTDGDARGTWIAVNGWGVSVALLNRYQDAADPTTTDRRRSRGLLVRDLAAERSVADVLGHLRRLELDIYAPFTLLVLEPHSEGSLGARRIFWNGSRLSAPAEPVVPLASSGHDPRGVPATRARLWARHFRDRRPDGESCLAFHRCHLPEQGAHSPCMHRPDALSVSLTRVVVDDERVSMAYADGSPCEAVLSAPVTLERLPSAAAA